MLAACLVALVAPVAASAATPAPAPAPLHVTSSTDNATGSLRDVITHASDGATVVIDPGINPTLTNAGIQIGVAGAAGPTNLTIVGQGARATTITGDGRTGSIFTVGAGTVGMSGLTLTGGAGGGQGGAIDVLSTGSLTLTDMMLTNNNLNGSEGSAGGAIYFSGSTMTLDRVVVAGNSTGLYGSGGGVYFGGGTATISNSTIANNSAIVDNSGQFGGGGLEVAFGMMKLKSDTFYGNNGGGVGDNIWSPSQAAVTLQNTIVANSSNGSNCAGTGITSSSYNLEDTAPSQCGLSVAQGDLIGVTPLLSPLANHGGPTDTLALGTGSPAIDAVPAANCPIAPDQRGLPRPDGSEAACDIGAYEVQDSIPVLACTPASVAVGQSTTCTATVTNPASALAGPPSGVVSFTSTGSGSFSAAGSCTLAGSGGVSSCAVSYTPTAVGSGEHVLTATYSGDSTYPSASATTTEAVTPPITPPPKAATSGAVTCSPGTVEAGKSTTCTAKVNPVGNGAAGSPTGSVSFTSAGAGGISGGGSCTLVTASCSVTYTLGASASGTYTVTAGYGGDANYAGTSAMTNFAAAPVAGVTANVTVISGTVLIKLPSSSSFVPLAVRSQLVVGQGLVPIKGATVSVPIGSTIDAHNTDHQGRKGQLILSTAADYRPASDRRHTIQSGTFAAAIFTIEQESARRAAQRLHRKRNRLRGIPATKLRLRTPTGAVATSRCKRHGPPGKGVVRQFSGVAKGLFQTIGANSITTVHSAVWIVEDRCDGTLTEVGRGRATVTSRGRRHQHSLAVGPGQGVLIKGRFL